MFWKIFKAWLSISYFFRFIVIFCKWALRLLHAIFLPHQTFLETLFFKVWYVLILLVQQLLLRVRSREKLSWYRQKGISSSSRYAWLTILKLLMIERRRYNASLIAPVCHLMLLFLIHLNVAAQRPIISKLLMWLSRLFWIFGLHSTQNLPSFYIIKQTSLLDRAWIWSFLRSWASPLQIRIFYHLTRFSEFLPACWLFLCNAKGFSTSYRALICILQK